MGVVTRYLDRRRWPHISQESQCTQLNIDRTLPGSLLLVKIIESVDALWEDTELVDILYRIVPGPASLMYKEGRDMWEQGAHDLVSK